MRFVNEDWQIHQIISPPDITLLSSSNPQVPGGMNFESSPLGEGQTFIITAKSPGGVHYNDPSKPGATEAIIVEKSELE